MLTVLSQEQRQERGSGVPAGRALKAAAQCSATIKGQIRETQVRSIALPTPPSSAVSAGPVYSLLQGCMGRDPSAWRCGRRRMQCKTEGFRARQPGKEVTGGRGESQII